MTTTEDVKASPSTPRQTRHWRFIEGYSLSGAENMALDEALLDSVIAGAGPVLRFYTWDPYTLSLGVNQPLGEVSLEECRLRGFAVVRRMTGGRAVLHQHELTYSVIASSSDPCVSGGVIESYRKISAALVAGLRGLGVDAAVAPPSRAARQALIEGRDGSADNSSSAVCFNVASDYELTAGGRKLVGSAQARRGGALLQHGSILLDVDWEAWASVFAYRTTEGRERAAERLPLRMTALREQTGKVITPLKVANALKAAFQEQFEITLDPSELETRERVAATQLAETKYGSSIWLARK